MSYGYSQRIVELNKSAPYKTLGVALGRLCIKKDVPVAEIAKTLGVSRTTVYNWFTGWCIPAPKHQEGITELINQLK
jgi:hypothetical protein